MTDRPCPATPDQQSHEVMAGQPSQQSQPLDQDKQAGASPARSPTLGPGQGTRARTGLIGSSVPSTTSPGTGFGLWSIRPTKLVIARTRKPGLRQDVP